MEMLQIGVNFHPTFLYFRTIDTNISNKGVEITLPLICHFCYGFC